MEKIASRLQTLKEKVRAAAERSRRNSSQIRTVLVSKTVSLESIREAFRAGATEFGENRVQELTEKKKSLLLDVKWHMIGHLQTNKVKDIIGGVALIHSLDRLDLFRELERQAGLKKIGEVPCLIQVNSSGETSKFGLPPEKVQEFTASIPAESPVKLCGLMTIGPNTENPEEIRKAFRKTKELQRVLQREFPERNWDILSMGMSSDFEIAIEEGSTLIRVGTAVFGPRETK